MTEKTTQDKTTKPKATADSREITLDRDMRVGGVDRKKGDKVTVSQATADWIANLSKPAKVDNDRQAT